jgi:uncharacterized protein YciI
MPARHFEEEMKMFLVLMRFGPARAKAGDYMEGHRRWLQRGFDEGVFVLSGSLKPNLGGAVLAYNTTLDDLQQLISEDPFVAHDVVQAEVLELAAAKAIESLHFLAEGELR